VPAFNDYKLDLQYIEVPLTLKLKTNEIGYLTYYGQIGITPGVKLKGRVDASSNNQNDDLQNTNVLKDINFVNLALTVGGGIEYSLTKDVSLLAGIYFNNGFINVIPKDGGDENVNIQNKINKDKAERPKTSDGEKISMNNVSLRLGFMF
jgi:opacity protein-like surface antigen